jgi:hypothetical protein
MMDGGMGKKGQMMDQKKEGGERKRGGSSEMVVGRDGQFIASDRESEGGVGRAAAGGGRSCRSAVRRQPSQKLPAHLHALG